MERSKKVRTPIRQVIARFFVVFASLVLIVALPLSFAFPDAASGRETNFSDRGYANQVITGNEKDHGGWNENVFFNTVGEDDISSDAAQNKFLSGIEGISNALGPAVMVIALVLIVARLAGRGVYEMAFRKDNKGLEHANYHGRKNAKGGTGNYSFAVMLIMTGDERSKGEMESAWVVPMLKESILYFCIAAAIWLILAVIAAITSFIITNVISTGEDSGMSFSFNVGGVEVTPN